MSFQDDLKRLTTVAPAPFRPRAFKYRAPTAAPISIVIPSAEPSRRAIARPMRSSVQPLKRDPEMPKVKELETVLAALTKDLETIKRKKPEIRLQSFLKLQSDLARLQGSIYEYGAQLQVQINGTFVGPAAALNFINGTNSTVKYSVGIQGAISIEVDNSGALSPLTATGTIDDSNKAFTFASKPTVLVINGALYQQTGGAITWTWNSGTLTATLSIAVGTGGSIFGL